MKKSILFLSQILLLSSIITAQTTETLRDEFSLVSFSNNNGSKNWKTDWIEFDIAGVGPSMGNILITNNQLSIDDQPDTGTEPSIEREADLTNGIGSPVYFSFNYGGGIGLEAGEDFLAVEVSSDGGDNYTIIETIDGDGPLSGSKNYDISTYASGETRVRFRIAAAVGGPNEFFTFDNVQIQYEDNPLPVELTSFSAVLLENKVQLKWRTETEVSNYGFEVEKQVSSGQSAVSNWEIIGFVEGHGNSNSPKDYAFIDMNATAGKYSYRLKQIDTDGKFEYSKVIEVDLGSPMNYELSQNYPNPFNPSTTIRFTISESSFINLSIFNALGEKIEELVNEDKEPGIHTIEFNAKDLPSGTYFYRIQTTDFVQTNKMILLK